MRSPASLNPRVWSRLIKRWLPRSLFGRSLLIIVLPVVLMQGAVAWVFYDAHEAAVTRQLSEGLAGDIRWIVGAYKADPSPANLARLSADAETMQSLSVAFQPGKPLPMRQRAYFLPVFDRTLRTVIDDALEEPFWVDLTRYPAYADIRVKVNGGVLRILAPKERAFSSQSHVFLLWLALVTVVLTGVAIGFIRNQVRAIERLAAAAEAFGRGAEAPRFKPHGAREVRLAAQAFLDMRDRIRRQIEQRTALLASVSHDLRTPLTRLKLEAALAEPSPRIEDIKRDLAEMEHMIDEYLAFARGQGGEAVETVGLWGLLQEVSEGAARAGARVKVDADPALAVAVRPNAFKRALSNLVMNAAVHGERVAVSTRPGATGGVEITVDDDGPGIPPERVEDAFAPFNRLDEARNQNEKGVGLGLAIARDVARGHGGDVTLEPSPMGGLRAVVKLPG